MMIQTAQTISSWKKAFYQTRASGQKTAETYDEGKSKIGKSKYLPLVSSTEIRDPCQFFTAEDTPILLFE